MPDVKYDERLICYIDILGFKELVALSANEDQDAMYLLEDSRPKDAKGLLDLFKALLFILQNNKESHFNPASENYKETCQYRSPIFPVDDIPDFQFTVFSDTVVFSANKFNIEVLYLFCDVVISITEVLFESSTTCRGGIAWGKCYHQDSVIFGPAMIEAYSIEQAAVYPRVIISSHIIEMLNQQDFDRLKKSMVSKDDDGLVFIDIIKCYSGCPEYNQFVTSFTHGMHWLMQFNLNHQNLKVRDKYNWYRSRFNKLLKEVKKNVKAGCTDQEYIKEFLNLKYFP